LEAHPTCSYHLLEGILITVDNDKGSMRINFHATTTFFMNYELAVKFYGFYGPLIIGGGWKFLFYQAIQSKV
jgi:hypothetical protein